MVCKWRKLVSSYSAAPQASLGTLHQLGSTPFGGRPARFPCGGILTDTMNEQPPSTSPSTVVIVGLSPTFQAFGMVIDFLSDSEPFGTFEVSAIAPVIRTQLQDGHNLAAMEGDRMVGYIGWLLTTKAIGEEWAENRAILRPMKAEGSDAAALTIFVSDDKAATARLIRGARELNKGRRVFFKRGYDGQLKHSRKATVLNVTKDG